MNETTIKIESFRVRLKQKPELILLDCVDDYIDIAYITKEFIFLVNGDGKLPPDTGAVTPGMI